MYNDCTVQEKPLETDYFLTQINGKHRAINVYRLKMKEDKRKTIHPKPLCNLTTRTLNSLPFRGVGGAHSQLSIFNPKRGAVQNAK